jgi:hypothetical protein
MSKIEVDAVEPQSGTTLTLGASGDTITIPAGATISNSGTAAGFGPTGAVSWDTTKITADPNPAVSGVGYFADTTSAAFTITLPSTPSAGAVVGIADYANTFATNNLTIGRNGSNIGGVAANSLLSTNGLSVTFVYVDATQGWVVTDSGNRSDLPTPEYVAATGGTVSCCGDYKIHTFTGPGTFTVTTVGNPLGSTTVDYLVVAGGGAGGGGYGGGGGAGGFRQNYPSPAIAGLPVTAQGYPITVGAGGTGGSGIAPAPTSTPGINSVFSTITSTGGGAGLRVGICTSGFSGGSGGGGSCGFNLGPKSTPGGAGNTPPVSPPQGNSGGAGTGNSSPTSNFTGGGGGGASAAGANGGVTPGVGGNGGAGSANSITGSPVTYAGGGGGGFFTSAPGSAGTGGAGGGGNAATTGGVTGGAGTVNTGGGGGASAGSSPYTGVGGAGGSGIVVIRYKFQ